MIINTLTHKPANIVMRVPPVLPGSFVVRYDFLPAAYPAPLRFLAALLLLVFLAGCSNPEGPPPPPPGAAYTSEAYPSGYAGTQAEIEINGTPVTVTLEDGCLTVPFPAAWQDPTGSSPPITISFPAGFFANGAASVPSINDILFVPSGGNGDISDGDAAALINELDTVIENLTVKVSGGTDTTLGDLGFEGLSLSYHEDMNPKNNGYTGPSPTLLKTVQLWGRNALFDRSGEATKVTIDWTTAGTGDLDAIDDDDLDLFFTDSKGGPPGGCCYIHKSGRWRQGLHNVY
jgi:hypothetical protein